MSGNYVINRWKGSIRGLQDTKTPHKACPECYTDCTSTSPGQLLQYACPRGHTFTGHRNEGLNHALWINRYFNSPEQTNR
jgi:hypothetical protein